MGNSVDILDQRIVDKNEDASSVELEEDKVKTMDITQQQWFWDQAVMS